MAVNVGERHVKDTPAYRQLDACSKALDLAIHTIKICNNKRIFTDEFQKPVTDKIIECVTNIYTYCYTGNDIYVTKDNGRWIEREKFQLAALKECSKLKALITIAKRVFHLKNRKVTHWIGLAMETKNLIRAWHDATKEKYDK